MKWKPKDIMCGVPGRGFIKAEDYNQQDENNLIARAKNRGIDVNLFMIHAGFLPSGEVPQLEIALDEFKEDEDLQPEPTKRKRRTKAEMEADQ